MTTANVAQASGTFTIGGDLTVNRLGFGAMRLTGKGVWGPPDDHDECIRVLRRAVELGVNFIDTADSYGPYVSEELIYVRRCTRTPTTRRRDQGRSAAHRARTSGRRSAFRPICARSAR